MSIDRYIHIYVYLCVCVCRLRTYSGARSTLSYTVSPKPPPFRLAHNLPCSLCYLRDSYMTLAESLGATCSFISWNTPGQRNWFKLKRPFWFNLLSPLSLSLSVCLPACLPACLSVCCLSVRLSVCPSVSLSLARSLSPTSLSIQSLHFASSG